MEQRKDFIYFDNDGIMEKVRRPEYGEVLLKFKQGRPYDASVTEKIKL